MGQKYNTLILGASYGSLLAIKMVLAGHSVRLVCLPEEAELFNRDGAIVRMPLKGRDGLVEINSNECEGSLSAGGADDADPSAYDLVVLAMQEPQYRSPGVRELLDRVGQSGKPCMSIMNMPPLPYLGRIPNLDTSKLTHCYTDPFVWENVESKNITLCSPDPQAFRPPEEPLNVLQVSLPTNFKAARFESDDATSILRQMQADIEAIRYPFDGGETELPVKLKVHDSVFVPLAKWAMLLTGNYRCVQQDDMRSIRDSVHTDMDASRRVYDFVKQVCEAMGADMSDLVPFEKYANAANGLAKPSSAARALLAGAPNIERADCLVKTIAVENGMQLDTVDQTVAMVDSWLEKNRAKAG